MMKITIIKCTNKSLIKKSDFTHFALNIVSTMFTILVVTTPNHIVHGKYIRVLPALYAVTVFRAKFRFFFILNIVLKISKMD